MKHIQSPHNPELKQFAKLLSSAKERRRSGFAVLEGAHLLDACLNAGLLPQRVLVPDDKLADDETAALLARLPERCTATVDSRLLAQTGSLNDGGGILALLAVPPAPKLPQQGDCVVLEAVQDPGNLGTVLRSAAAAGVRTVVLGKGCADAYAPKVLRAGMGAHFALEICERADLAAWRADYRGRVLATTLGGRPVSLYALDLRGEGHAWLFGNEGSGLSAELAGSADETVLIPMQPGTESLNVAMAATVCLFEQFRQRLQAA